MRRAVAGSTLAFLAFALCVELGAQGPASVPSQTPPPRSVQKAENPGSTPATNQIPSPSASVVPRPVPADTGLPPREKGGFTLKVDVSLVLVEATVRDDKGRIANDLKREDFRLLEDGVEQQITHFLRDELPLAVALVVDGSSSIAPVLRELHQAAYDTLSQLKPEDQVSLFAFAAHPARLEDLTIDRKSIAERLTDIGAAGGTNIADALYESIAYLGQAARGRRHAVILVSDNQPTVKGKVTGDDVIRLALETQTIVYSVRIGRDRLEGTLDEPVWIPGARWVNKIMSETGGEIIDLAAAGSVRKAMAAVITRLKQRYTLGYQSTNTRRDGAFREIDVRLADRVQDSKHPYRIFARRGYYAALEEHKALTE